MFTEDQQRYVARMIGDVRNRLMLKQENVSGQDIVFTALCDVSEIQRRQKVGAAPQGHGTAWPHYVRTKEEIAGDIAQRWIDVEAGDPVELVFGFALPTPQEISTMDAANVVFRSLLRGSNQDRDWRILHMLTVPHASFRRIAKVFHITHTRVADIKVVQTQAIWDGVKHLLPAQTGEHHGTVWVDEQAA